MRTLTTAGWMTAARWTEADARAALDALRDSGEAVTQFAATHGVEAQRLYGWRRRLSRSMTPGGAPVFVEVKPELVAGASGADPFEVMLLSGEVVRVPQRFDERALRSVLAAVRGGGQC